MTYAPAGIRFSDLVEADREEADAISALARTGNEAKALHVRFRRADFEARRQETNSAEEDDAYTLAAAALRDASNSTDALILACTRFIAATNARRGDQSPRKASKAPWKHAKAA
ncbi:hypothetical protein [Methylocella sp.]|jgi:hypothetical protein|uniref:hypothetical protein n=1 Tax=Methylocella sp. TaxID=1978226 RepID=UPI003C28EB15